MGPSEIRQSMNSCRLTQLSETVFSSLVQHQWQFRGLFATASLTPTVFQASTGGHSEGCVWFGDHTQQIRVQSTRLEFVSCEKAGAVGASKVADGVSQIGHASDTCP